jgi:hypothetical protein
VVDEFQLELEMIVRKSVVGWQLIYTSSCWYWFVPLMWMCNGQWAHVEY